MTPRDRFLAVLRDGRADLAFRFEREFTDDLLANWRAQGLPAQVHPDQLFALDRWRVSTVHDLGLRLADGARPPRHMTTPAELAAWQRTWRVTETLPDDWPRRVAELRACSQPFGLHVFSGLFLTFGVEDGADLIDHGYFLADHGDLAAAALAHLAEVTVARIEPLLREAPPDCLIFGEPIASHHAPVIGPRTFKRIVAPYYRRLIEAGRGAGVPLFVWETYGQVEPLIPAVLDTGITTLWIAHANGAGTSYAKLRRRLGPDVGLLGGLDARPLLVSPEAAAAEVDRVCQAMPDTARWIPFLDDRPRPNVPWAAYRAYRERLNAWLDRR